MPAMPPEAERHLRRHLADVERALDRGLDADRASVEHVARERRHREGEAPAAIFERLAAVDDQPQGELTGLADELQDAARIVAAGNADHDPLVAPHHHVGDGAQFAGEAAGQGLLGAAPGAAPASRPVAKGAGGGRQGTAPDAAGAARAGPADRESGVADLSTVTIGVPASGAAIVAHEQTARSSCVAQTIAGAQTREARTKARTRWTIAGRVFIAVQSRQRTGSCQAPRRRLGSPASCARSSAPTRSPGRSWTGTCPPAARPPKPARGELSSLLGGQSRLRANFRALLAAKPVPGDEIARFWPPKLARGNFSRRLGLENDESISSGEILAEKNG